MSSIPSNSRRDDVPQDAGRQQGQAQVERSSSEKFSGLLERGADVGQTRVDE